MLLFVYGTLRKGFVNHMYLKDSPFVENGITIEPFTMIATKSLAFPYLIKNNVDFATKSLIKGEIYDVTDAVLERIDSLEGHPHHYKRSLFYVRGKIDIYKCFIYVLEDEELLEGIKESFIKRFISIPQGDWALAANSNA